MAFEQIWGQTNAITILRNALIYGRLAHAYLFVGPEGVGKHLTAVMLAKAMNCQWPSESGDCCERCPSCIKINSSNHADVILVEPDGEMIKIDQIRGLQRRLHYRPMEGGRRACLIDPADKMNEAASNALLKTLEEPPEETHLFLITSRPHRLLSTIQSRCQWVKFKPLSSSQIIQILQRAHHLDLEKASFYASLAGGSAGQALSLSDRVDFEKRLEWLRLFTGVSTKNPEEIWEICERLAKEEDLHDLMDLWKLWVRDLLVCKIQGRGLINHDLREQITIQAERYSLDRLDFLYALVSDVQRAITLNANRQLALETLLLGMRHHSQMDERRPIVDSAKEF